VSQNFGVEGGDRPAAGGRADPACATARGECSTTLLLSTGAPDAEPPARRALAPTQRGKQQRLQTRTTSCPGWTGRRTRDAEALTRFHPPRLIELRQLRGPRAGAPPVSSARRNVQLVAIAEGRPRWNDGDWHNPEQPATLGMLGQGKGLVGWCCTKRRRPDLLRCSPDHRADPGCWDSGPTGPATPAEPAPAFPPHTPGQTITVPARPPALLLVTA